MSRLIRGLSAALLVTASPALARAQAAVERQRQQRQEQPPPRAKGDVTLALVAPTTRGVWTVRVTNEGDVPVRIAADARVLALDVTARGARAPVRCELPEDMRPDGDLERPLVLPPGRSYAESFEARLYCFGEKKAAALAPGSIVVAHLGWTGKRPSSFEVSAIEGVEPHPAPRGAIDAPPIILPDEPTAPAPAPATGAGESEGSAALSLVAASWVDAESASAVELPVTLRNDGKHAVAVRYRPEFLRFDVLGPGGVESCAWPVLPGAPAREQFTTLSPKAENQLVAALTAYCSSHAFDEPGFLVVRARVDTRESSGALVGLRAFEGELVAPAPTLARLHRGRAPKPIPRPKLEETR